MYLYDASGRQLASANNGGYSSSTPQIYFKINEECGYTLTPATTYKYKFYAIVNGQTYWSGEGSFKTGGDPTYTITVNAAEGGTVTGGGSYKEGQSVTVEATAKDGYRFEGWTENGRTVSTSAGYSFTVSASRTLTAIFEKAPVITPSYIIITSASPAAGGTVSGDGQYLLDTNITVTATPNDGYVFKGWTENGNTVSAGASYSFTVSASRTLTAVFEKTAPADPATATVEREINDSIEQANRIAVNTEIAGSLSKSSDVDWYVFQIPNDGYISLTFDHDFVNSSSFYWKTAFYTSGNQELNSWQWRGNATSAETGSRIGVSAGTYYLRISDWSYSDAAYRFKVNYAPSSSWEKEFNETIVTANPISTGTEISGSIRNSSDVDWYQFELPKDGMISLTFDHDFVNSSSFYWKTAFYTSDNQELNSWQWRGNAISAETGGKIGLPAGTYYLRISDWGYSDVDYRFKVNYTPSASWEKEFNETIVTANRISTGREISGSIRNSSDVDWYQFKLPEDGMISLTFSHDFVNSSSFYWKTAFYTSDNKELNSWTWRGNATSAETGSKIGVSAGTYYLRISDWGYSDAAYRFKVNYDLSQDPGGDEQPVAVSEITLNKTSISLTPGKSAVLTATVTPSNASNQNVTWTSSNNSAAKVDSSGRVTAVAAGTAIITVQTADGGFTATCRVVVKADTSKVTGVTVSPASLTMAVGDVKNLTATVTPSSASNQNVTWTSNDNAIATVDSNGRVIAVAPGLAVIRATTVDGGFTTQCRITIEEKTNHPNPTPSVTPSEVHFSRVTVYHQDQFTDVPANQWYTDSVAEAFELGLMKGNSATTFKPDGNVTIAEAVTMASRLHAIYTTGSEDVIEQQPESVWYQAYLDYAYRNKIINDAYYNSDVTQTATRAQFAEIFANSLPDEALAAINTVEDGRIPDVPMNAYYADAVYKLYRAGVLTGGDVLGTFSPASFIARREAATIISRMAESNNRKSFTL